MSGERNPPDLADLSAYLDGELSPEECARVEEAIARDPAFAAEWDALKQTSSSLRSLPTLRAPESVLEGIRSELQAERVAARPQLLPSVGSWAALFLLAAAGFVFFQLEPTDHLATQTVKSGAPARDASMRDEGKRDPVKGEPPIHRSSEAPPPDAFLRRESKVDLAPTSAPPSPRIENDPAKIGGDLRKVKKKGDPGSPGAIATLGEGSTSDRNDRTQPEEKLASRIAGRLEDPKSFARSNSGAIDDPRRSLPETESSTLGVTPPAAGSATGSAANPRFEVSPQKSSEGSWEGSAEQEEVLDALIPVFERSLGESAASFELTLRDASIRRAESSAPSPRAPAERNPSAKNGLPEQPELKRGRVNPEGIREASRARAGSASGGKAAGGRAAGGEGAGETLAESREITVRLRLPATTTAEDLERLIASIGRAVLPAADSPAGESDLADANEERNVEGLRGKQRPHRAGSRGSAPAETGTGAGTAASPSPGSKLDPFEGLPLELRQSRPFSPTEARDLTLTADVSPRQVLAAYEALDRWRRNEELEAPPGISGEDFDGEVAEKDTAEEVAEAAAPSAPAVLVFEGKEPLLQALRSALAARRVPVGSAQDLFDGADRQAGAAGGQDDAMEPLRPFFEPGTTDATSIPIRFRIVLERIVLEDPPAPPAPAEETQL